MEFGAKYPDTVSVYFIGPNYDVPYEALSKEFCGGPHVSNTKELGVFKIIKEDENGFVYSTNTDGTTYNFYTVKSLDNSNVCKNMIVFF